MNSIESALANALSQYSKMPLVIAYSGGVDSQVLLHALVSIKQKKSTLCAIPQTITVCHVNHGLSVNAGAWQAFAEQECHKLNLRLKICQVNVQTQAQKSLEALARDARYKALQSIYNEPSLIITGHHSDDQAETFLLALKRGSGLKGLSAMAAQTQQSNDLLVRPLLNFSRRQIINYAKEHNLVWVEDESNSDTRFDRNFIRNDVMPLLTKRWPSIVKTINRSSEHCHEGQLLLDELAAEDFKGCRHEVKSLLVNELGQLSKARFNNLIRYFLELNNCFMPSTKQLAQIHKQLNAADDKNPAVKVGEHYLRRYKDTLFLTDDFVDITTWQAEVIICDVNVLIKLPNGLEPLSFKITGFSETQENCSRVVTPNDNQKITIRFDHNNPKCLPDYRNHSRSLKKVLQELNIPPWQRKRIPFLYYDDVLVAALGYFVCQEYLPKKEEPSLEITWTT